MNNIMVNVEATIMYYRNGNKRAYMKQQALYMLDLWVIHVPVMEHMRLTYN